MCGQAVLLSPRGRKKEPGVTGSEAEAWISRGIAFAFAVGRSSFIAWWWFIIAPRARSFVHLAKGPRAIDIELRAFEGRWQSTIARGSHPEASRPNWAGLIVAFGSSSSYLILGVVDLKANTPEPQSAIHGFLLSFGSEKYLSKRKREMVSRLCMYRALYRACIRLVSSSYQGKKAHYLHSSPVGCIVTSVIWEIVCQPSSLFVPKRFNGDIQQGERKGGVRGLMIAGGRGGHERKEGGREKLERQGSGRCSYCM